MTVKLPPHGGTDRQVATAVNQALDGKLASVRKVAVTGGATSLTVDDPLVSANSAVFLMHSNGPARDATIATANGQFTVTFSPAAVAGDLVYVVLG